MRGDGGVVDVLEAQTYWDDDAAKGWSQRWILISIVVMYRTYSRRTEKAKTTIAFSLNFMRSDQTNNSEMLKMKISSATAVSSTPFHRRHYVWSASVASRAQ